MEGVVGAGPNDQSKDVGQIVNKGKRTKRQRPHSPIPFTIPTNLSTGEGEGKVEDSSLDEENNKSNKKNNDLKEDNYLSSSPATSSDGAISTTTEDEDAARLLILLAQGNSRESSTTTSRNISDLNVDQNYTPSSYNKFSSKRYIETSSKTGGGGMIVYECKTCNRTFSSFQALGGHRASHKKPKNLVIESRNKQPFNFGYSDDNYIDTPSTFTRNFNSHGNLASPLSYQTCKSSNSSKIHDCSYCGAEFTSGQALGGHMRRHRGSNGNLNRNNGNAATALTPLSTSLGPLSPISVNQDSQEAAKKLRKVISLSLDLNLPAPEPENGRSNLELPGFAFDTKQQLQHQHIQSQPKQEKLQETPQQQKNNEPALSLSTRPTSLDYHF